jgi:hypothetical protein
MSELTVNFHLIGVRDAAYLALCAAYRLPCFWGEVFPHSVTHISDLPGYRAAGIFSACWRKQYCDAYPKSGSSCKTNRITDCMVLLSANYFSGSVGEVFNPSPYTVPYVCCSTVGLFEQIHSGLK